MIVSSPSLYQINTRVTLADLSRALGRHATLDDIPDRELDRIAQEGFDWVWLGLAVLADIASYAGGGYGNRKQLAAYAPEALPPSGTSGTGTSS